MQQSPYNVLPLLTICVCTGADFTLEKLVEIGLDQHAELVGDISSAASKELAVEQVPNTHTCIHRERRQAVNPPLL